MTSPTGPGVEIDAAGNKVVRFGLPHPDEGVRQEVQRRAIAEADRILQLKQPGSGRYDGRVLPAARRLVEVRCPVPRSHLLAVVYASREGPLLVTLADIAYDYVHGTEEGVARLRPDSGPTAPTAVTPLRRRGHQLVAPSWDAAWSPQPDLPLLHRDVEYAHPAPSLNCACGHFSVDRELLHERIEYARRTGKRTGCFGVSVSA